MTSSTCMGGHVRFHVPFVVTDELGLSAMMFVCCPLSFILCFWLDSPIQLSFKEYSFHVLYKYQ